MLANIKKDWVAHIVPLVCIAIAGAMFILTPVWAFGWYGSPFLGMLLEPNNVVSQVKDKSWAAASQEVVWSDRLVSLNGLPMADAEQVNAFMRQNGFKTVNATFTHRSGEVFTLQNVLPIKPGFGNLFSLFIIPYLVGVMFLGFGVWAYRIRPELRATRAFVILVAAISVVTTTYLDMLTTHHVVLLWGLSLPVAAGAGMYLTLFFPLEVKLVQRWRFLVYLPWTIALVLGIVIARDALASPTPYAYIDSWRWGYILNALSIFLLMVGLVTRIFSSSISIVRQQSRVIIFGVALAFLPILLLYLIPIGFSGQIPEFRSEILFPPLIFFPLSVAYAILRYRLLDVDRWFARALTYVLTMGVALAVFYTVIAGVSLLLSQAIRSDDPLVVAGYVLLLVIGFQPVRNFFQRAIDRVFYRSHTDYRRVLAHLSKSLVVTPDLQRTLSLLETELGSAVNPEKFVVFLYEDDRKEYVPYSTRTDIRHTFQPDAALPRLLLSTKEPLWLPPERTLPPMLVAGDGAVRLMGCQVFVPLLYEERLIGFFALGARRSGERYVSDDLDFLVAVAGQSTLSFENARLFENLRHTLDETSEMKNLMDDIFASIATGVITTDMDQKITLFNRAAETILGLSLESVIGKPLQDAIPTFHPELGQVTSSVIMQGLTEQGRELTSNLDKRGDLYLRLSATPLRDAYLATKGATIVFENLTETRKVEAEREVIRQTFGRVVSPRVRDRILADAGNLQLHGARRNVTILFADLSSFTSFTEKTSPESVFKILNSYLDIAAQAILDHEGTLDKFMGDAVMAMWNSPDHQTDHALLACLTALQIVWHSLDAHKNFSNPDYQLVFRVGVATGPAIVGNVGTSQLFNYTAVGDTVNVAERLQTAAPRGQVYILKSTYDIVKDHVLAEPIAPLTVKGREQPVEVYLLKGMK
ncbi:MAG: adenylate/guanylate cyclase domain-containing protein [Anaerolineales bacterium]